MALRNILSTLAGILFLAGFVPYIAAILRKETKPAKVTWIIWASLDTILFLGMLKEHAVNGQIVGAVCGAWIVAILSLRFGTTTWTAIDVGSLVGGVVGLLQLVRADAITSIQIMCVVGFVGSIPTFASAWKNPAAEDKTAWTIFWLSCACAVLAIPSFTWQDAAQPFTFFTIETIMMYILYIRGRSLVMKEVPA